MEAADLPTSDAFGVDAYPIGYIGQVSEILQSILERVCMRSLVSSCLFLCHDTSVSPTQNSSSERATVKATNSMTESARPIWHAIQVMNWAVYNRPECKRINNTCHTPRYAEVRGMVWITIAGGANGVFLYSIYDLAKNPDIGYTTEWAMLSKVSNEVQRFAPMLLSDPLPSSAIVATEQDGSSSPGWLMLRSHQLNSTSTYVFAVSDGRGGGMVTLRLSSKVTHIHAVTIESDQNGNSARRATIGADRLSFSGVVEDMEMVAFRVDFVCKSTRY
eukprot:SAG31_NODE_4155_length_3526_cov_1.607237_2_plen_275_part_00